ncbi:hypothetical protein ACH4T9_31260 [Micromonospora sp. NPDC020750]|uniref:hypothetical protein n=1 Tax=unclassified Micromonospora TaxID=2617518 RepID=UPI0037A2609A
MLGEFAAVQWNGRNHTRVAEFLNAGPAFGSDNAGGFWADIATPEGLVRADLGDWIIEDSRGQHRTCKPDVFEAAWLALIAMLHVHPTRHALGMPER